MKKTILLTGANGHLGKAILQELHETSYEIRALIMPQDHATDDSHVHYYKGDVLESDSLLPFFANLQDKEVYLLHAAGIVDIQRKVSTKLYDVNVLGTKTMLQFAKQYHIKRFLYTSSVHAIPEKTYPQIITEVHHFDASLVKGGYAKTKALASQLVMDEVANGLDAVIVHPSGILGPYGTKNNYLVQMISDYLEGKLLAGVSGGYDFVEVREVAKGFIAALEHGEKGYCYILSNQYYKISDILDITASLCGKDALFMLPMWVAKAFAPIISGYAKLRHQRPLYTPYSLYTLASNVRFSHEHATTQLDYQPRSMKDTLRATIAWYQSRQVHEL